MVVSGTLVPPRVVQHLERGGEGDRGEREESRGQRRKDGGRTYGVRMSILNPLYQPNFTPDC